MSDNPKDRIYSILPRAFVQALADATERQEMTMVVIIDDHTQRELAANRPAMIEMEDGAIVVLIPQERVTKAYQG